MTKIDQVMIETILNNLPGSCSNLVGDAIPGCGVSVAVRQAAKQLEGPGCSVASRGVLGAAGWAWWRAGEPPPSQQSRDLRPLKH